MYWRSSRGTSATMRRVETMNSTTVSAISPGISSSSMVRFLTVGCQHGSDVDRHDLLDHVRPDGLQDDDHSDHDPAPPHRDQRFHRLLFHEPEDHPEKQRQCTHDPSLQLAL